MTPKESKFTVDIIGQQWTVYVCRPWNEQAGVVGECNCRDRVIRIDATTSVEVQRDSLLHELLHAMMYVSGASYGLGEDVEERIVYSLTPVLLETFRRNAPLFRSKSVGKKA